MYAYAKLQDIEIGWRTCNRKAPRMAEAAFVPEGYGCILAGVIAKYFTFVFGIPKRKQLCCRSELFVLLDDALVHPYSIAKQAVAECFSFG